MRIVTNEQIVNTLKRLKASGYSKFVTIEGIKVDGVTPYRRTVLLNHLVNYELKGKGMSYDPKSRHLIQVYDTKRNPKGDPAIISLRESNITGMTLEGIHYSVGTPVNV